jgi:hypothetical protein
MGKEFPMTIEMVRSVIGWCAIINYAVLILWFLVFRLAHDWIYRLHSQWFPMPIEQFNVIHYAGMAVYKIGVRLLTVVPYVALVIMSRRGRC